MNQFLLLRLLFLALPQFSLKGRRQQEAAIRTECELDP